MQLSPFSGRALKTVGYSTFVALMLGVASHANAQQTYSTTFDDFEGNATVSGQDNWDTNDPAQPDLVQINGYSTSGTDQNAQLGGNQQFSGAAPSLSPVYLFHPFTPAAAAGYIKFDADFAILPSSTAAANNDTFGFTFRSGTTNLFSVDFVPNAPTFSATSSTLDSIEYSVGNGPITSTMQGFGMNQRAHLTLFVNDAANTMTFTVTTAGTALTKTISLAGVDPTTVDNFAATYIESVSGAPGTNSILFDNVSAVPEPKTYAMLALGALGLGLRFWRRARA